MVTEEENLRVLDLLTESPRARIEALGKSASVRLKDMRIVLNSKNVVGVGISEKIADGKVTKKLALTFYVDRKLPLRALRADKAVPPTVPDALTGTKAIPTDVIAIGCLRPDKNHLVTRNPV